MIPAQAVEAAARAICVEHGEWNGDEWDQGIARDRMKAKYRKQATKALEAAAPHMLAGLRADLVKLAKEFDTAEGGTLAYTVTDGRFGMRKNAHDQLMYVLDDHTRTPDAR